MSLNEQTIELLKAIDANAKAIVEQQGGVVMCMLTNNFGPDFNPELWLLESQTKRALTELDASDKSKSGRWGACSEAKLMQEHINLRKAESEARLEQPVPNNEMTLNIGLVGSERFKDRTMQRMLPKNPTMIQMLGVPYIVAGIVADLQEYGFDIIDQRLQDSSTEPTLVIKVKVHSLHRDRLNLVRSQLCQLANRYAQDCIAVKYSSGTGELIGSYAKVWGEFNDDYFINF